MRAMNTLNGARSPRGRHPGGLYAALLGMLMSVSFAATAPAVPPAGAAGTVPAAGSPPPAAAVPVVPPASSNDYIIGPGDTIQVFVWRNPELTSTVPVRPDGKISTPLVEDLVAVGKSPAQLARDIETRLAEYVRSPQVSIIVSNALSAYSQIKVVGQVKNPHAVPYQEGMTLLDVVLAAGGLTDFAAGNRSKLVRKDEHGKDIEIRVKVEDLLKKGRLKENQPVKPGDLLLVPEAWF